MIVLKPAAVLWDMDGTLIDSEEFHWLAWRDTMAGQGVQLTHDQFLATFGLRNDSIIPQWLGDKANAQAIVRVGDAKELTYRGLVQTHGMSALPGVERWVRRLHADGWLQAVASSAPRANVETVLAVIHLGDCFEAIVSAEDVRHGKPDPEVFLTAASRLGVPPDRCIVVEDAAAGVEAARRAGMHSVGVARAGKKLDGDVVVSSLEELAADSLLQLLGEG